MNRNLQQIKLLKHNSYCVNPMTKTLKTLKFTLLSIYDIRMIIRIKKNYFHKTALKFVIKHVVFSVRK